MRLSFVFSVGAATWGSADLPPLFKNAFILHFAGNVEVIGGFVVLPDFGIITLYLMKIKSVRLNDSEIDPGAPISHSNAFCEECFIRTRPGCLESEENEWRRFPIADTTKSDNNQARLA